MRFSLLIHYSPTQTEGAYTALQFAQELIAQSHTIYRVFLYRGGVALGNELVVHSTDELDIQREWQAFAKEHQLDMVVCIAAGLRRGLINETEAARHGKLQHNLAPAYDLSGLGQWVDAVASSDRFITF